MGSITNHCSYFILILIFFLTACHRRSSLAQVKPKHTMHDAFDWQGHRGARGLLPENTIPSFIKALEFPLIRTLELDLVVTKDGHLIVSHEPWMSALICSHPDGSPVTDQEEKDLRILEMTLSEVQTFDCGKRANLKFPEQLPLSGYKPSLKAVVEHCDSFAEANNRPLPYYNIEIKSAPEWDDTFTPTPEKFAALVVREIHKLGIADRSTVQSFDTRTLQALKRQSPQQQLAYLVENHNSLEENLELLGCAPDIYSPYYPLCDSLLSKTLHDRGIKLIPWTVNETAEMQRLISLGVDGIITDYPNRIPKSN